MCENITNKYLNYNKIKILEKNLKNIVDDNPKLIINNFELKNNKIINVIQYGMLLVSTK
jgi:hypothetical protein